MTLVELMVALTISLVILAAMSQIFATSRATYTTEEGLARVQEGGRFSLDMLAYEIRQAGFFGCGNVPPTGTDNSVNNVVAAIAAPGQPAAYDAAAQAGIQGFRYTGTTGYNLASDWSPALSASGWSFSAGSTSGPASAAGEIRAGSDVLVVKYATSNGVKLTNTKTTGNLTIRDTDAGAFNVGQALMVTNCNAADFFVVTGITGAGATRTIEHAAPLNSSAAFQRTYGEGDELLQFFAHAYYVGNTARNDRNGNSIPALFRRALVGGGAGPTIQAEELVEGVEAMQVYYGVLRLGGNKVTDVANRYVPANQISTDLTASPNWTQVTSTRVGLVVSTPERASSDSENTSAALNVLGLTTDTAAPFLDNYTPPNPSDGRPRRVFSFVVHKRQPPR
jgi:type IV pilus assembly protein PilW